jgi:hypothetical protein
MEKNGMESSEDKKSKSNLLLLLQLINAGAEIDSLLNRGLQYSQIADLIFEAIENEFVLENENGLELTALGLERIKNAHSRQNVKGNWISPLDEFRVKPLPIDEIYTPTWETRMDIYVFNFKAKSLASSGKPLE